MCHRGSTPIAVPRAGIGPAAVGHQRGDEQHEQGGVEQRVERGSVGVLGQWHPVGPGWQPDGAGPQPVQDRAHRREVAPGQRPEAATEADDFEQHRVEHGLLEHDRLRPPRGNVGEAVDTVVDHANSQPPRMYSAILTPYITGMISGVPNPFSAIWRVIGTIRSARVRLVHSAMSTTGRLGWMNPIAAPSTNLGWGCQLAVTKETTRTGHQCGSGTSCAVSCQTRMRR